MFMIFDSEEDLIIAMKKRGVKVEKYTDLEKGWMIFFSVFVIAMGSLLALPYLI